MAKRNPVTMMLAVSAVAGLPSTAAVAGDVNVGVHIGIPAPPIPPVSPKLRPSPSD
jgi:hypothetical protein